MKHRVYLNEAERKELRKLLRVGRASVSVWALARILLKADRDGESLKDQALAIMLEVGRATVARFRQRFCEGGLADDLHHWRPRGVKPSRLDGRGEAHLIALACGPSPAGRSGWSLRLLANRMVELGYAGEKLAAGESKKQLLESHPGLTAEGIDAALASAASAFRADTSYPTPGQAARRLLPMRRQAAL